MGGSRGVPGLKGKDGDTDMGGSRGLPGLKGKEGDMGHGK